MFHRSPQKKYKAVEESPNVKESKGTTSSGGKPTIANRFSVTKWIQCGRSTSTVFEENSTGSLYEVDLNRSPPTNRHHDTDMAWTESTSTGETSQTSYYSDEEDEMLDSAYDRYFDEAGSYDFTDMQQLLQNASTAINNNGCLNETTSQTNNPPTTGKFSGAPYNVSHVFLMWFSPSEDIFILFEKESDYLDKVRISGWCTSSCFLFSSFSVIIMN